jgi:hypothetical protein
MYIVFIHLKPKYDEKLLKIVLCLSHHGILFFV